MEKALKRIEAELKDRVAYFKSRINSLRPSVLRRELTLIWR